MTEAEWLTCADRTSMLEFLKGTSSDRKLRLFAVASCRAIWDLIPTGPCRNAIDVAEQFADDARLEELLRSARDAARDTLELILAQQFEEVAWSRVAAEATLVPVIVPQLRGTAVFLRDIFGNPFRPVTFDPRWRTTDVVGVAQAIYEDRAFERLPILADALMDAGCADDDILAHCRSDVPHVRGCWVVDLVLGKE